MHSIRAWRLTIAMALTLTCSLRSAPGDTIKLKTGSTLEGKIESETADQVRLRTSMGLMDIATKDIDSITRGPSPLEQYNEIRKDYPRTADGHYRLALWCRSHRLPAKAREHYRKALEYNPDHAQARLALGYVREGDAWVKPGPSVASRPAATGKNGPAGADPKNDENKLLRELITRWNVRVMDIYKGRLENRDESSKVFADARTQILAIHDPLAISALATVLSRGNVPVRLLMVEALGGFTDSGRDEATMNLVVVALLDPSPRVRLAAARALVPRRDERVIGRLRQALSSKEDTVVRNAADALGLLKAREAVPDLATVLYTVERRKVRYARQEILGEIQSAFGRRVIMPYEEGRLYYDPQIGVVQPQGVFVTIWEDEVRDVQVVRTDVQEALIAITGQNFGFDADAWIKWYRDHEHDP